MGENNGNLVMATNTTGPTSQHLSIELGELNEKTWLGIGNLSHAMDEWDKALAAYESALRHNPNSTQTLHCLGRLLLERDQFGPAIEVFQRLLSLMRSGNREEILAEMALCWLGLDDLGKSSAFIQKAVQIGIEEHVNNAGNNSGSSGNSMEIDSKEEEINGNTLLSFEKHCSTLWYALGLYHDRLGNEEAALDAYLAFIESERKTSTDLSDRAREVYYRLGVIYRLTGKFKEARECFDFVRRQLSFCVRPSSTAQTQIAGPCQVEVLMQLALIDEAEGDFRKARMALERLLVETSSHGNMSGLYRLRNLIPKLRQKLGCLALSHPAIFENDSSALALLLKATEEDPQDALNWYYLGRLYLQLRQPTKAYDAYQQAVYRDGRNASFWNSIGLLYFNIGQFRDALDAFTRAVHHAPQATILWWNLGLLYETCHGIGSEDSREAFQKGLEYCRNKNDLMMMTKFETKLKERRQLAESSEPGAGENLSENLMEMDANRFVMRLMAVFPRPQSAASMSRFLTYRGHQAQARRPAGTTVPTAPTPGQSQMFPFGPIRPANVTAMRPGSNVTTIRPMYPNTSNNTNTNTNNINTNINTNNPHYR